MSEQFVTAADVGKKVKVIHGNTNRTGTQGILQSVSKDSTPLVWFNELGTDKERCDYAANLEVMN